MPPPKRPPLLAVPFLLGALACGGGSEGGGGMTEPEPEPTPTTGSVKVLASTSGSDPDPNGYSVTLGSDTRTLGVNGSVIFSQLPEGTVTVELSDVIVNCATTSSVSRSADVVAGDTSTVEFAITCDPAGTIAFQTERNGNWDIYLIKGNGQNVRGLPTSDVNRNTHPAWRPDGEMIAYHTDQTGEALAVARVEPKNFVARITNPQDVGVRSLPDWSPDGSQLVFFGSQEQNLYKINRDGSGLTELVANTFSVLETTWSPSGRHVAFTARIDPDPQSAWTVQADGSNLVKLIDNNFNSFFPDWSPDGSRIVFVSQHTGLFVADADGSNRTQISNDGGARYLEWSPSGDQILFENGGNLFLVNPDGTERRQLTDSEGEDFDPEWSPDGSRIVFVSDRGGNNDLFAIRATADNLTQLTTAAAADARPTWRP